MKINFSTIFFTLALSVILNGHLALAGAPFYGPATINLTVSGSSQIALSWNSISSDPATTGYRIDRESPSGNGFTTIVANTNSTLTTYTDTGLSPATNYGYRIFAINADGLGPESPNTAAITTALAAVSTTTVPLAPQNLTATAVSATEINVSWTQPQSNPSVTGYRIERQAGAGFTLIIPDTGSVATTYADTNLSPGATYDYRITAINAYGFSPFGRVVSATTYKQPMEPRKAVVTAGDGQATVSWTTPLYTGGGLTGYLITASQGTSSVTATSGALSAVIAGLTNGVSYYFSVRAINPAGQSPAVITNTIIPMLNLILPVATTTASTTVSSPSALPVATTTAPAVTAVPTNRFVFTFALSIG
ncbi:MAG: fibronectin type III domain-containing protein, partial [Candidatus Liptonbacteria bacterium]|nr:fibronectin type III domain-containing protein [Candidatus Liptonbacteria bacterium]